MRNSSQKIQIEKFISELGKRIKNPTNLYFTGGATAVFLGIRETTIDVDVKFEPDSLEMYRAIQELKEKLNMNIELASPDNFIPPLPQWKERSVMISTKGKVNFFHYDLYSQIIAKVQRGWKQDLDDAKGFLKFGIDKNKLWMLFENIVDHCIKYPSVDVKNLAQKLKKFINEN